MRLVVCTDWDFGIRFDGRDYCDNCFTIEFDDLAQLDQMELLGPFGSPGPPTKYVCLETLIATIKADPTTTIHPTGGNRSIAFYPEDTNYDD